jgi:hypothetical protein
MPRMQRVKTGDCGSAVLHLCGAMRDPRTPEIMAWLRRLPPRDRLATMYAVSAAFPIIKNDREWTHHIDAVVTELNPTSREHADIKIEAGRISRTLKRQLKSDEADNERQRDATDHAADLIRRWHDHPRLREHHHGPRRPAGLDEVRHGRAPGSELHGRGRRARDHLSGIPSGDWLAALVQRREPTHHPVQRRAVAPVKDRFPRLYIAVIIGGTMAGSILGDHIFPGVEAALGFPLGDFLFGILGALLASVGWEIVSNVHDLF